MDAAAAEVREVQRRLRKLAAGGLTCGGQDWAALLWELDEEAGRVGAPRAIGWPQYLTFCRRVFEIPTEDFPDEELLTVFAFLDPGQAGTVSLATLAAFHGSGRKMTWTL